MRGCEAIGVLVLGWGLAAGVHAQERGEAAKPKVPLVSVVGCASRLPDGSWLLTEATDGAETKQLFTSAKELEEAKKKPRGKNRYKLVGTADFGPKEELLKQQQRAEFTRPDAVNATGELQAGRRLAVKGLLVDAPKERTLNLVSVIKIADTCK